MLLWCNQGCHLLDKNTGPLFCRQNLLTKLSFLHQTLIRKRALSILLLTFFLLVHDDLFMVTIIAMPKYIAFLKAINVGGHIVKMDYLRQLFEEMGFSNVKTFIASGNVIFDSASKSGKTMEKKIEEFLHSRLGYK